MQKYEIKMKSVTFRCKRFQMFGCLGNYAYLCRMKLLMPMMKISLQTAVLLLTMLAMVQCGQAQKEPALTEEELRVAASQRIDSTAVRTLVGDEKGILLVPDADSVAVSKLLGGLTAEAWMLVEDSTGLLLSTRNAHQRMFPASLTKMMTCMLALERGTMGDTIRITEDVFLSKDSRVRLGDSYLLGDMIREMMLQSDNDAANAIAKNIGGDIPAFCQLMNEKAAYLGMDSTHFANPNGMPNDSTYSTAR